MRENRAQWIPIAILAVVVTGCGPCGGSENDDWAFDVGEGDSVGGAPMDAETPRDADTGVEELDVGETSAEAGEAGDTAALPPAVRNACGVWDDAGGDVGSSDVGSSDAGSSDVRCRVQQPESFGDCGETIGAVFDGAKCVEVEGCPCQGSGCPAFESIEACARECGRSGWCQRRHIPYLGPDRKSAYCPRESCFGPIAVCARGGTNPEPRLEAALAAGEQAVDCRRSCVGQYLGRPQCSGEDDWCCTFRSTYTSAVDEPLFRQLCRLSLMPSVVVGGGCIRRE